MKGEGQEGEESTPSLKVESFVVIVAENVKSVTLSQSASGLNPQNNDKFIISQ